MRQSGGDEHSDAGDLLVTGESIPLVDTVAGLNAALQVTRNEELRELLEQRSMTSPDDVQVLTRELSRLHAVLSEKEGEWETRLSQLSGEASQKQSADLAQSRREVCLEISRSLTDNLCLDGGVSEGASGLPAGVQKKGRRVS